TSVIFAPCSPAGILFPSDLELLDIPMTNSFTAGFSWIALHWWILLIAGAVGIAATCTWCLETDETRTQRAERNRKKELRRLADQISTYGRNVHQRYPTGDVVVSERDLVEQFRKRPDAVTTALHILLNERKVQKAPLKGYWKLNA
ncbi:MAG TPA: hypothetical protein VFV92_02490, partial [Candidatus Bathyarchaeia archaeon]|nr:hypothetical protein [Candidatus Bathyarchaeia archaeon]